MKVFVVLALLSATGAAAFVLGRATAADETRDAPATRIEDHTVRVGEQVRVPSVALFCRSYVELGTFKLLCNRTGPDPRYQVIFERGRTEIGRIGDPGDQRLFPER
jgi:hypothetical protein